MRDRDQDRDAFGGEIADDSPQYREWLKEHDANLAARAAKDAAPRLCWKCQASLANQAAQQVHFRRDHA